MISEVRIKFEKQIKQACTVRTYVFLLDLLVNFHSKYERDICTIRGVVYAREVFNISDR